MRDGANMEEACPLCDKPTRDWYPRMGQTIPVRHCCECHEDVLRRLQHEQLLEDQERGLLRQHPRSELPIHCRRYHASPQEVVEARQMSTRGTIEMDEGKIPATEQDVINWWLDLQPPERRAAIGKPAFEKEFPSNEEKRKVVETYRQDTGDAD